MGPGETFDAGAVFATATPNLVHSFPVRNTTGRVVHILSENHSCDCTDVTLGKRELKPGESTEVVMNVRVSTAYSIKDVSCVLGTDLPGSTEIAYHIKFESFPDARIVPDRIDIGTFTDSYLRKPDKAFEIVAPETWLEVFTPATERHSPLPTLVQSPSECTVTLGQGTEANSPTRGVRLLRHEVSIRLNRGNTSPGVFARPINISLEGRAGASAVAVWTVRSLLNCEPSRIHFGSVAPGEPAIRRKLVIRSSDSIPFRVLSLDESDFLTVDQSQSSPIPSSLASAHTLNLSFQVNERSSRFMAGALRIRTDRDDYPEVLLPWSAFLRDPESRSWNEVKKTNPISQAFEGGSLR